MSKKALFHFKKFTVSHSKSSMKVGTDGVLLGAWTEIGEGASRILDIGTGTGLIALMTAQRHLSAEIIGIDIEPTAVSEAALNFQNSPWSNRLKAVNSSVQEFNAKSKFDMIISNPPFIEFNFHSIDGNRSVARQQEKLTFEELIKHSSRLLNDAGAFSIIIPAFEKDAFIELAVAEKLYPHRICEVKGRANLDAKRVLTTFKKKPISAILEEELVIEIERHKYTEAYIDLVKDFYLNM